MVFSGAKRVEPGDTLGGRLLGVRDVASWLGVSSSWIRDHASGRRRPKLPCVKLGKSLRFRREDVEAFINACER